MRRDVPYEMQTLKNPNPVARFAHQARYRTCLSLVKHYAPTGATVLDFGAGQGEFLHQLGSSRSDLQMFAFEPFMHIDYPEIQTRASMDHFESDSINVLCAFETLEHLAHDYIDQFISQTRRVCKASAIIIISVPIMQGIGLPIKEASRAILFRRLSDYSLTELIRGTCGLQVNRATNILTSHKGFDQRTLYRRLSIEFQTVNRFFGPIRALPWWCNSQAFFVFMPSRPNQSNWG
jgi:2-polyprenyl-3-methyl-5-hydroxy-6-metoxy-1,4-benzoquinol methylase